MKSPGVYTVHSAVKRLVRPVLETRGVFVGVFCRGPIDTPVIINNVNDLLDVFGPPTDYNYNDWFQVANYLAYNQSLYVIRAVNLVPQFLHTEVFAKKNYVKVVESNCFSLKINKKENLLDLLPTDIDVLKTFQLFDRFTISGANQDNGVVYTVTNLETFGFEPSIQYDINAGDEIIKIEGTFSASLEIPPKEDVPNISTEGTFGYPAYNWLNPDSIELNVLDFNPTRCNDIRSPLSVWARSPGHWGNGVEIAIILPQDIEDALNNTDISTIPHIFPGTRVDQVFKDRIKGNQIGVAVRNRAKVVETYVVTYENFEQVINGQSKYIFVKLGEGELYSTVMKSTNLHRPLTLLGGRDGDLDAIDVASGYERFNDDIYEFDVVIGNERDNGLSAMQLAEDKTAIAFIGAPIDCFQNANSKRVVENLVQWRKQVKTAGEVVDARVNPDQNNTNAMVSQSSSVVLIGNYLKVFDKYNGKYRLVNIAGDIAGLRASTNSVYGEWRASAGTQRGRLNPNVSMLLSFSQSQRDIMYTNNINPVLNLPEHGTVFWGNRTLAHPSDPYSAMHVRSMMNMIAKSAAKTLTNFVMDNIDTYTLTAVQGSIRPLLMRVKGQGGIEDYSIAVDLGGDYNNELVVSLFIKPTGVAERICIRLFNTGSESVSYTMEEAGLTD